MSHRLRPPQLVVARDRPSVVELNNKELTE